MRLVEVRRVSTEEQARNDRAGLERQANANRARAEQLDAHIFRTFVIVDVSRVRVVSTPEWTAGIRPLIQQPDVHIIVDAADRLVAGFEGVEILAECQRTRTRIFTSNGELDLATAEGRLLGALHSVIAGNELDSIKHRAQGGKEAKRRMGRFPSFDKALATGIGFVRETNRWTYSPDVRRVQRVFELFVHEGINNLAEVGRRTGFSAQTARNLLRNPIFKGWLIFDQRRDTSGPAPIGPDGRRKDRRKVKRAPNEIIRHQVYRPRGEPAGTGDNREEAAVFEATWDAAQELLDEKRRDYLFGREPNGSQFYCSGLLRCAPCQARMWGKSKAGKSWRRHYYVCKASQIPGGSCDTGYVPRDKLHAALDRLFSTVLSDERLLAGLVEASVRGESEDFDGRIAGGRRELERLATKRAKLLELYLDDRWTRAELDARRTELDGEIDREERELRRLEQLRRATASEGALDAVRDVLVALLEFEFWTPTQKRELMRKYFPRISVSRRGIETVRMQVPLVTSVNGREVSVPENQAPLDVRVEMSWEELQPPAPEPRITEFGLPEKAHYTRRDVAEMLGLREHQVGHRLSAGEILEPAERIGGKRAWSPVEMAEIRRRFYERRAPHRWGLPRKALYTSGDVCLALGIEWERLRYLLAMGVLPDCAGRSRSGQRRWTEAEVERVVRAYGEIDPGEVGREGARE